MISYLKPRWGQVLGLGLVALLLAGLGSDPVGATGNISPGKTIANSPRDPGDCYWDTTLSVTSSTLDSLNFGCTARFVSVVSLTASMNLAVKIVGDASTLRDTQYNRRRGLPRVDGDLTTFAAATGEYLAINFGPITNKQFYGLIVDGQSTGSVYIRVEP